VELVSFLDTGLAVVTLKNDTISKQMIHLSMKIPSKVAVAVSGGCDSMAVIDFLHRKHDIIALHYNHGTPYAPAAEALVRDWCSKKNIPIVVGRCEKTMPPGVSKEAWWRDQRYHFFAENANRKIVTAHHLDDCVETWIFTSLNGNPFLIPQERDQYIRPFLTTPKKEFVSWCERKKVPFIEDPSNSDTKYRRNFIRHKMIPLVKQVNPGIDKVIRKKVLDRRTPTG
jgi:tRNA(Ile)-lysidine synthase